MKAVVILEPREEIDKSLMSQCGIVVRKRTDGGLFDVLKSPVPITLAGKKDLTRMAVNVIKDW